MPRSFTVSFRPRVHDVDALFDALEEIPEHERRFPDAELAEMKALAARDQLSNAQLEELVREVLVQLDTIGLARGTPQSFLNDLGFEL